MRTHALEYHDVIAGEAFDASGFPGPSAASYKLRVPDFEAHLAALAASGVPVLLTFDDGGVSALTEAAPLLSRYGWAGHFFVTTGRIGTPGFLDAAQVAALHAAGHAVGSHSASHPARFAALTRPEMLREWTESRSALERILGAEVRTASVPGGYFSRAAAETAAEAGFRVLFTSEPVSRVQEVDGCRVVGRYTLRRSSTASEAAALAAGRIGARGRQWGVWNAKKVLKAVGGRAYLAVRERVFERGS